MGGFWQAHYIEMPCESWGEFIAASAWRAAGAHKGSVFDKLPKSFFSIPNTLLIDNCSEHFDSRDGSELFLCWHVGIINSNYTVCAIGSPKHIFSQFIEL